MISFAGKNNLKENEQSELLGLLRELAFSEDKNVYQSRLNALYKCKIYEQNNHVQRYLQQNWLGCIAVSIQNRCINNI